MERVRLLLRLSSKGQTKRKGYDEADIPDQRNVCMRFLESKPDWILQQKEYIESGVSAYKTKRANRDVIQDAVHDAESGDYDILLLWKGDRLARRVPDMPGIVEDLTSFGVEVWSVIDASGGKHWTAKTAMDLFMLSLEGFKNQSESESISIRTKEKKRQMGESGMWRGSRVPFGYILVAQKDANGEPIVRAGRVMRKIEPHPERAAIVRELYRRYLAGEGFLPLSRWLNATGVPTYSGVMWDHTQVRQLIMNPFYAGLIRHEGKLVKGQHEGIVSQEVWNQAQEIAHMRHNIPKRQQRADYPLTGMLYCDICGGRIGGEYRTWHRDEKVRAYRCRSWRKTKCGLPIRKADDVEREMVDAMGKAPHLSQLRQHLIQRTSERNTEMADYLTAKAGTEKRLREVGAVLNDLMRQYLELKVFSAQEYVAAKSKYIAEREQLEVELAKSPPSVQSVDFDMFDQLCHEFPLLWEEWTPAERKQAVMTFCATFDVKVILCRDGTVELRTP